LAEARGHLEVLQKAFPQDGEIDHLLGQCHEADGQYAKAADCFARAVRLDPSRVPSYVALAALLRFRLDDPRQADDVMDRLVKANAASAPAYVARARYDLARARQEATADARRARTLEAGTAAGRALALAPEDAQGLLTAAEAAEAAARLSTP